MPALSELEDRGYRALMARERRYELEVNRALRQSLDKVRVDMARIYDRYAKDGKLSLADMTRYNRLTTLEKSVIGSMNEATRANIRTINRLRPEQYEASFFRTAWAVDQTTGVATAWGVLNRDTILENIASPFFKISVETYGPEARATVRRALNNGLAQGQSYTAMMKDIKKAFDTTAYRAMRIVRTEGQTAVNAGQDAAYTRAEEKGIEGSRFWDATLDGRTRPTTKAARIAGLNHRVMDGQAKHDDGLYHLPNGETAPFPTWQGLSAGNRVHCRCRERFQITGYEPQVRRSREQGVIPYQTYEEWEKGLNAVGRSTVTAMPVDPSKKYINKSFQNASPDMLGLLDQHQNYTVKVIPNGLDGASYNPKTKTMKLEKSDLGNPSSGMPWSDYVVRHEYGHYLDSDLGGSVFGGDPVYISSRYTALIKQDADKYFKQSKFGAILTSEEGDNLQKAMRALEKYNDPGLSDAISAATGNSIAGAFTHSPEYFSAPGNAMAEIFANSVEMYAREDKSAWRFFKKQFPKYANQFEEIIKGSI